jgi:hypothetical protein
LFIGGKLSKIIFRKLQYKCFILLFAVQGGNNRNCPLFFPELYRENTVAFCGKHGIYRITI